VACAVEWEAPAIVLDVRPYGEGDAIATVLTEAHGRHRGLARGGAGRRHAAIWQKGNLIQARWVARLADQLGSFSAELAYATAALALDDALELAVLSAACAVAEGALPEREPHPRVFAGLVRLLANLAADADIISALVRWETELLADLGYGLDLSRCAVTGHTGGLAWVSPTAMRATCRAGATGCGSPAISSPATRSGRSIGRCPPPGWISTTASAASPTRNNSEWTKPP
jgi:DNA repair protein RecO (recombination protein O)